MNNRFKTATAALILMMLLAVPMLLHSRDVRAVTISPSSTPNLKIKQIAVPGPTSDDDIHMSLELIATCLANCPTTQTGEWASDWSYVTCLAAERPEGGYNYFMKFQATNDDWPTSWPSTVTCSKQINSDLYTVTANIKDAFSNTWNYPIPEEDWNPSNGLAFNFQSGDGLVQAGGVRYLVAPSDSYAESCPLGIKGGSAWTGVRCCVDDRTDRGLSDVVIVAVNEFAAEGTGTCAIPKTAGGYFTFSVSVDRP